MNILAMPIASTFIAHRKYFRFWRVFLLKKTRKWRAVYFDKVSSQSRGDLEMYKNKKASQVVTCKALICASRWA